MLLMALHKSIQEYEEGSKVLFTSAESIGKAVILTQEREKQIEVKRKELQERNEEIKRETSQLEKEAMEMEQKVEAEQVQRQTERDELDRQLGM